MNEKTKKIKKIMKKKVKKDLIYGHKSSEWVKALIRMGNSYRDIQKFLGCSVHTCVKVGKELVSKNELVNFMSMRQITRLTEEKVDVRMISRITGFSIEVCINMQDIIKERDLITRIFNECSLSYGVIPGWDSALKMFWRDFAIGSIRIKQLKDGKFDLIYFKYHEKETGLVHVVYDNFRELGLQIRKLYGPKGDNIIFWGINGKQKRLSF